MSHKVYRRLSLPVLLRKFTISFLAERHQTLAKRLVGETTAHRIITCLLSSLSAAKMIEDISQAMLTPYRTAFPVDSKSYSGTHSMNTMYPVSRRYVILHFRDQRGIQIASLRYRNHAEMTVLMGEQKPSYPGWLSCRPRGGTAIYGLYRYVPL